MRYAVLIVAIGLIHAPCAHAAEMSDCETSRSGLEEAEKVYKKLGKPDVVEWRKVKAVSKELQDRIDSGECHSQEDEDFLPGSNRAKWALASGFKLTGSAKRGDVNNQTNEIGGATTHFNGDQDSYEVRLGYEGKPLFRDLLLGIRGEAGLAHYRGNDLLRHLLWDAVTVELYGRYGTEIKNPDSTHGDFDLETGTGFNVGVQYQIELEDFTEQPKLD